MCSGWLLLFPGVLWMVAVISYCALEDYCCLHKQSTRKLHRTWDSSTEVSPRPEIPAVVWTGALRTTPLDAGPHSETDPDPIPWPTRCSTVRSPTPHEGIGFKKERKGQVLSGGSVGQWVGGRAKTGKLPKHWRRKQKLRRGTTSVCTSRAQENCTGLGYSFSAVPSSHTTGPTTGSQPQRNVN